MNNPAESENTTSIPFAESDSINHAISTLISELSGLFHVREASSKSQGQQILFEGWLIGDPEKGYQEIGKRFSRLGYTPLLRRENGTDIVVAMMGLIDEPNRTNPLLNIILFIITIVTTLSAGAQLELGIGLSEAVRNANWPLVGQIVAAGMPFSLTLLGILGVHELGHYLAARWHHMPVSLPYFIPLPVGLGTLGALIRIKAPMKNRRVLFDIGLAGPFAGLLVAVPLFLLGLSLSSSNIVPGSLNAVTLERLGSSIFSRMAVTLLADIPDGQTLQVHPILYAAWWGIFVTGLNLFPVGQLDGGHAVYALFGRYAHGISLLTFLMFIIIGSIEQQISWFVLAIFIMVGGLRHPPPLNDMIKLGWGRKVIGVVTALIFILIFIPRPF